MSHKKQQGIITMKHSTIQENLLSWEELKNTNRKIKTGKAPGIKNTVQVV